MVKIAGLVVNMVGIDSENSNWHLEGGLRVGSTIDELKTYNQGEFYFYGFDWDYGGDIINENLQGKMKKLRDVLGISLKGVDKTKDNKFTGDREISSNTANLFKLTNAKIKSIYITLKDNYLQPKPTVSKIDYGVYSMFGKLVTKDDGGSIFSSITIQIEPNKYFQYFREYDKNTGDYCKKKIIKPMNYGFSIALERCTKPTQFYKNNERKSTAAFWGELKSGTLIGIRFENGYLKTKSDGYTLLDQGDGPMIAERIDIL